MNPLRILLVDDHEGVRRGLRSLLSRNARWMVCGEAVDGIDAIEKVRTLSPDVVLMDISMPRMNGLDATRVIRDKFPKSKVIIVSQNDPDAAHRQAQDVSAEDYVTKSEIPYKLIPTLERVIASRNGETSKDTKEAVAPSTDLTWLAGDGTMGELILTHDWSKTPLGPIEAWPQSLKASVDLILNSRHPMWIGWGREMTFLYNDACIPILSLAKHPSCLGQPASEVWSEIWNICGPFADRVFEKGEATFVNDVRLFMNRGDFLEETYYLFSYSPVHDEVGNVAGLFCLSTETTAKILNARRLKTLSELSSRALVERSPAAACASCFETLAKNSDDIPFAILYLVDADNKTASLEQSTGVSGDLERITPSQVDLNATSSDAEFWKLNQVLANRRPEVLSLGKLGSLPVSASAEKIAKAIALPVTSQDCPIGILIAGINPGRQLDSEYRTFFDLLAGPISTAIINARAAEQIDRMHLQVELAYARGQAEEASRQRTTQFEALLDAAPVGVYLVDADFRIQQVNPPARSIFKDVPDLIGRDLSEVIQLVRTKSYADAMVKRFRRTLETGEPCVVPELVAERLDGQGRDYYEWRINRIPLPDGRNGVVCYFHDISAQVKAREELWRSENRLRHLAAIVDSSGDAIISKDLDGVITSWNKSAEDLFGYTPAEAIGRHITMIIPAEREAEERMILERIKQGEPVEHFETVRVRKDGSRVDLSLTISPVRDASGTVTGASKAARDISERRRAEDALGQMTEEVTAAQAKFRAVFEQTSVFAGIMTLEGRLIDANHLSLEACGYTQEEVLGKLFWEAGWWRGSREVQAKIRAATLQAAQGIAYREVLPYLWADGTERLVELSLHPIVDDRGRNIFLHPTGVDVTDLKRTEEKYRTLAETLNVEVRARTKELEQRNLEVMQQSHQLRELSRRLLQMQDDERRHIARELHDSAGQILTALGMNLAGVVQLAREHMPQLADTAQEGQQMVTELSQEIRTMSYLLHPPLLDESGLTEALRWYIQGLKERSGLEINLTVSEDFNRVSREMELVIFRIVQECLTNIHRHSGSNTAEIRLVQTDQSVFLEIQDQGKGMTTDKLAEIQTRGIGVGVRGMRERVLQFGGSMDIKSDGGGTTILFTLPFSVGHVSTQKPALEQAPSAD